MSAPSPQSNATRAVDAIRFRWLALSILIGVAVLLTLKSSMFEVSAKTGE